LVFMRSCSAFSISDWLWHVSPFPDAADSAGREPPSTFFDRIAD
jgi:hypothetical protein